MSLKSAVELYPCLHSRSRYALPKPEPEANNSTGLSCTTIDPPKYSALTMRSAPNKTKLYSEQVVPYSVRQNVKTSIDCTTLQSIECGKEIVNYKKPPHSCSTKRDINRSEEAKEKQRISARIYRAKLKKLDLDMKKEIKCLRTHNTSLRHELYVSEKIRKNQEAAIMSLRKEVLNLRKA